MNNRRCSPPMDANCARVDLTAHATALWINYVNITIMPLMSDAWMDEVIAFRA